MVKSFTARLTLTALISVVGLAACSAHSTGSSRYGGSEYHEYGYGWEQGSAQGGVCCGYYVVPVHHIITNEKQVEVEVEKEVIKELPPQIVYKNNPCPPDTTADANGACIRYVERPTPPVYICKRKNGLPCKK
ncbi:MAG: hypothetical protein EX271_04545 [Acidimicrobiales bacterium]|nr:hypothetical protein [Hyphomonadaceae bacterium]RZV43088.1 MAG: hypothetical protein EX271_04545 [Acidimicrobiales bacterium]